MALNAYLTLKGQKQGQIKGGVVQKGREGTIEVVAVNHDIVSPRDPASGLPTGQRMHKPLVITKGLDRSTPLLHNSMTLNENISSFKLDFYEPNVEGMEKNFYRIELVNASISDIHLHMEDNRKPENLRIGIYEEISFTYQKITWTILDPTTVSATDNWTAPVS